uniref:Secreted protein n=1 Tax=Panagrellus redivivus TaxID=6233 RepID=A0A7E4WBC8_PANRE
MMSLFIQPASITGDRCCFAPPRVCVLVPLFSDDHPLPCFACPLTKHQLSDGTNGPEAVFPYPISVKVDGRGSGGLFLDAKLWKVI